MTVKSTYKSLRQAGIYAIVASASVALTLGSLRASPRLLSIASVAEKSPEVAVVPSEATEPLNNQPRNFVAAAVSSVGDAVVRIDVERTVTNLLPVLG